MYFKIKEMIIYGKMRPGELLTVGEIADQFNISRTPVREAFTTLKHDGLLDVLPHKGYLVSRIDLKDFEELFAVRIILEGGAASLAAAHASKETIAQLGHLALVEFNEDDEKDEIFFMKTNFNFHTYIAKAAKNDRLGHLIANNLNLMQRVLYLDLKNFSLHSMQQEHMRLVEIIRSGDTEGAKKLAVAHIENSRTRIFS